MKFDHLPREVYARFLNYFAIEASLPSRYFDQPQDQNQSELTFLRQSLDSWEIFKWRREWKENHCDEIKDVGAWSWRRVKQESRPTWDEIHLNGDSKGSCRGRSSRYKSALSISFVRSTVRFRTYAPPQGLAKSFTSMWRAPLLSDPPDVTILARVN